MSSHIARIEIYENEDDTWSYGCPDLDLMGYSEIGELLDDIDIQIKMEKEVKK